MAGENAKLREKLFNDYAGRLVAAGGQADKGVIVRFRSDNDNGVRPQFRELWEQAKGMP